MILSRETRKRGYNMKTFILLYFLGLTCKKVSAMDNSTKVYYMELRTEKSIPDNYISDILNNFKIDNPVSVDTFKITTDCVPLENQTQCTCELGHIWSEAVCQSSPNCCQQKNCTFKNLNTKPMCLPETRVTVDGLLTIPGEVYYESLSNPQSAEYMALYNKLLPQMKALYSTLNSFDNIRITGFSRGSVIVHFELTFNNISADDLAIKTAELQKTLNATFTLETTGLVEITVPEGPVKYGSTQTIFCQTKEDMKPIKWALTSSQNKTNDVTTGTESTVTPTSRNFTVVLRQASEVWEGLYMCVFNPKSSNVTINHRASATLDIALLPQIDISSTPQFPDCSMVNNENRILVTVQCEINNIAENYKVTWSTTHTESPLNNRTDVTSNSIIYRIDTTVSCRDSEKPTVTCTFMNVLSQERNATVNIPVIYKNSNYCNADGDWPKAKAEFQAVLKCKDGIGKRKRLCLNNRYWNDEISNCVNVDLHDILMDSQNLAIGLGSVEKNAGDIFSRLNSSTFTPNSINTYANINASVSILSTMYNVINASQNNYTLNDAQLKDALSSSSNLLDGALDKSWEYPSDIGNTSMAERYLLSVEGLVKQSDVQNITYQHTNVELNGCKPETSCENKVFNVTVIMKTSSNLVKTIGFKSLSKYLPQKEQNDSEPNSIVVSTTIGKGSGAISIDFQLINKRPRNHMIQCVYWDFTKHQWSDKGCKWGGPDKENHCECNHLSSFTTLMSKNPEIIPYMNEITYAGLAVSIVSLLCCLVIECLVWKSVVKSSVSYCRHTAHINICLCLLIADCSFLASAFPDKIPENWCQIFVVVKHFCYLAMFFWMLCLSIMVLHQMIFMFHQMSKKVCLGVCFFVGYCCPLLIVFITFITYNSGEENVYYTSDTCWLVYKGFLKGSIFTFILPVGTIVVINVFCMIVVIMRLLRPSIEVNTKDEKEVVKGILKAIVLLTPIFGGTWIFGFFVLVFDITKGPTAFLVNYAFILLNAFQGLFILLTTYFGEKTVRVALLKYFKIKQVQSAGSGSSKLASTLKTK
ncbi:adhesion G protein-coupled receptor F5 isoform X2 [Coregonus clupeaformis]|uniref:adhesion G protein-coupled receptor F5 isoform X2 n=1 Tax=Coregonus clupeaformis TaxID=59861 RepID=UPI001BDF9980|nr:adhesion G protein-coupled receptor F5 isoform X2 [Coregonus clupeaformis]